MGVPSRLSLLQRMVICGMLRRDGQLTTTELAKLTQIEPKRLHGLLRSLANLGHVRRVPTHRAKPITWELAS